jgi:hypothetical protein
MGVVLLRDIVVPRIKRVAQRAAEGVQSGSIAIEGASGPSRPT